MLGVCCCTGFSLLSGRGAISSRGSQAAPCGGSSCCGAQALGRAGFSGCGSQAHQLWSAGLAGLRHVGSSWTSNQTHWQADSLTLSHLEAQFLFLSGGI